MAHMGPTPIHHECCSLEVNTLPKTKSRALDKKLNNAKGALNMSRPWKPLQSRDNVVRSSE